MRNKIVLAVIFFMIVSFVFSGVRVASDLHYTFPESLSAQLAPPYTWLDSGATGMGEYAVFVMWYWPMSVLFGLFSKMGLSFEFLLRTIGFFGAVSVGFFSMLSLLKYLKINKYGSLSGAVFYVLNSYFLLLLDGGQLNLALAYSVLPLSYLLTIKALDGKLKDKLFAIGSYFALSVFDIRVLYLFGILMLIKFVLGLLQSPKTFFKSRFRGYLVLGILSGIFLIGFHAYWLLPSILSRTPRLPVTYERISQVTFLSFAKLEHALAMHQPHWFENVFGKVSEVYPLFFAFPLIAFLALMAGKKGVVYWTTVALLSIFLVKGGNDPLPFTYAWAFTNIPGFNLFRDPTKFYFLLAMAYSVMISFTVSKLSERFPKRWIPTALFISLVILLASPVYLGKMTGTFSKPIYEKEYMELAEIIESEDEFSRTLWIPTKAPLGFSSPGHPALEVRRLVTLRPFAIGTVGTYETFNFLRESKTVDQLLDVIGVKYIVYPYPDARREDLKQDNLDYYHTFSNQLSDLDWLTKTKKLPVSVFETRDNSDRFFLANKLFVVGSDKFYEEVARRGELRDNALIFLEDGNDAKPQEDDKIVLFGSTKLDAQMALADRNKLIFPADQLDFSPNETGWWKRETADFLSWRAFLQNKYEIDNQDFDFGGGLAVSEGSNELTVSVPEGKLFARALVSSKGGSLGFSQNGEKVEIATKKEKGKIEITLSGYEDLPDQLFEYDDSSLKWFEVGEVEKGEVTISTSGELNVINALSILADGESQPPDRLDDQVMVWENLPESEKIKLLSPVRGDVSYERISPTHYEVVVERAPANSALVFSDKYDSFWEMDEEDSMKTYSMINAFDAKDGKHEVVFSPQKYVLPGLAISAITALIFLGIIAYGYRRQDIRQNKS